MSKYLLTSAKESCAAQSLHELRSEACRSPDRQSERTMISTLSPLRKFRQGSSYSPYHLVSQSAMFQERSVQCCKGLIASIIVLLMITGSYCRLRRHLAIFDHDEMWNSLCLWPSLVCGWDHRRSRASDILTRYTSSTKFGQNFWVRP